METRVVPVLEQQIKDGKINLIAIVNTHQYVPAGHISRCFTEGR